MMILYPTNKVWILSSQLRWPVQQFTCAKPNDLSSVLSHSVKKRGKKNLHMIFVFQNLKHHEHLKSCPIKHVISVYSWYTVKYKSTFRLGLPAFFVIGKSSYGNIHLSKDRLVLIILAVFDAFPLWWGLWNWSTWLFSVTEFVSVLFRLIMYMCECYLMN